MALTTKEFRPVLIARLHDFLEARAPDKNRGNWVENLARRIGASESSIGGYLWGDPQTVPQGDLVIAIVAHFVEIEGPAAAQEIFGDLVGVHCTRDPSAVEQENIALKKWIAELHERAGNGFKVGP